jgi:uncharacterized membrane protein YjjP (DUF1212 family)
VTPVARQAPARRLVTELLLHGGRLLLEYNESTGAIHRALRATARALTDDACHVTVSYRGVAVWIGEQGPALEPVGELRYNMAVLARVHAILEQVSRGALEPTNALARLNTVEVDTPRHSRWLADLVLGVSGAALAALLGADSIAVGVVGAATGLGLLVRQELGRRHVSLLTLPLTAAFVAAVLGGVAIRLGWTQTPEHVLIVPALMLVPGPHLINGLMDLIDNDLPMSVARFGLAMGIMLASGLGLVLGIELTLADPSFSGSAARAEHLGLAIDMMLAGIVACGFAVFYNTAWPQLWMAAAGGMAGHGLRYLALEASCPLDVATFLGGLAVGAVSAWLAWLARTPLAAIAFAGAVTMMPGLSMYRALAGALQLARHGAATDAAALAGTLGSATEACLVVGGLTLGLLLGARIVLAIVGRIVSATTPMARDRASEET